MALWPGLPELLMVVVLLAAACSWLFLPALIPQLRRRLLDQPNARSSHRQPTPRGGGIVFVAVTSVSSAMALLSGQGFPAAALPFSLAVVWHSGLTWVPFPACDGSRAFF